MSEEEREFLREALQSSNTIYQNQIHSIEKMHEKGVNHGGAVFQIRLSSEKHITRLQMYQEVIFYDSKTIQKGKKL